ncbi:cell wall-binding repeat-containing protein [Desulfosporosinus sp. PR]|uniref:cell wall-binding repeat-containing protein n=1 Tax=Candidatus Desulfosporosinus nitrosoreducens TaxID=3401928 RepID=UPI0027EB0A29|nr:cell wall-binding repeat-containing protein [Desulfosporosinus sp. PR]MDQ7093885.1 cell wall-binding repeat-containing protein [Desulfosporosinus sp. PR]
MKRHSLKLMVIILCLLVSTVIFPKNSLALTTPAAPTNLTATAVSSSQVYLTWDPVGSTTGYYIYRSTSAAGNYSIVASPATNSYTDSGLSPGTAYYYKVKAANILGVGSDSAIVYVVTVSSGSTAALTAPANLTATVASSSQIYLTWSSVSYATSYYVYRATSSSAVYTMVGAPTTTSWTDTGLTLNTTYYYKIQAVSGSGVSAYSSIAYATTTNSSLIPSAPANLTATFTGSNQIYLSWTPVSYATYYYVYRATSSSGPFTSIGAPATTNFTDSNVPQNTVYYYKVQAANSTGTSPNSAIVYATTNSSYSVPPAPSNIVATAVSVNQVYLTWDSVSNATYYYVYRSTSPYGTYSMIGVPTTTNYTDSTVTANTTYYYKLQAVGSAGSSSDSIIVNVTTTMSGSALTPPASLTATVISSNQVYLNWYPVSYANYYSVYRSTSLSGTYTIVGVPTTANYTDSTVSANTTYYYKVEAVGSGGSSPDSSIVYATTTTLNGALPAPTDVTATASSSTQIYLTWSPVSSATYYYVYRSTSFSGNYSTIGIPTSTNITDTGLSPNTTYYYKVVAVGSTGPSSDSAIVSANTTVVNGVLPVPANVTATDVSGSQIYLTWSPVSNATSYYVYRSTSPSDTYANIATVTTPYYTDSGLSVNTAYYYEIQAVASTGVSSYSSVVSATTSGAVSNPPADSSQIPAGRLAGEDLYGTSAEVAKSGWNTSYYAILVSGENFTDALCSAPFALKHNAPLLLTGKDALNDQTKTQLSRLKVKEVFIIGGVGVISSNVEQSIKSMGIDVSRIAGNDCYETSVKIAQAMGQTSQAIIASSQSFSDALSIAPIAAMKGIPILLTAKDALSDSVKSYLKNVQSSYVVGGTGVISDNVFSQLPSPKRLSGNDKYETNVSVIKEFANDLDFSTCYLSTGENFADALSGSALASLTNSPLFLVSNPVEQSTIDYFGSIMGNIKKEVIFGGTVVVPDSILTTLNGASAVSGTLSAPIYLTASTVSSGQINLSWDSVDGATSYYIYGSTSSSGTYTHLATVTTTSYANTGLWADTTYYYKVQAVNSSGSGPYSPIASATTNS